MTYRAKALTHSAVQASMAFQMPPDLAETRANGSQTAAATPTPCLDTSGATDASNRLPDGLSTGNLDLGLVDTQPGEGGSMSPPAGTDLTAAQYLDLMRKRYRTDPGHRQHIALYARRGAYCAGPYAEQARQFLAAIRENFFKN